MREVQYGEGSEQAQRDKKEKVYSSGKSVVDFMTLEEIAEKLRSLEADPTMKTVGRYSPTGAEWPNNTVPFSEVHLAYLRKNKTVNPIQYISNLELMIKIRS